MPVLDNLMPQSVFRYFEALCAIPHGSRNTSAIADFCVAVAEFHGLECWKDSANNVVIISPATPGYERAEPLILQGHLDMVCEKEAGANIDMDRDGLRLRLKGDFISADGTTLGGDDGIAVAMILAIVENQSIPHPRLECVLTSDEEIGMLGAAAFDASGLQGRRMLNLDSETEGIFTTGCAGGCTAVCAIPPRWESAKFDALHISIRGLTGGHSGMEIRHGRANANKLLGRILQEIGRERDYRLVRADGGAKDNAIPVAADAEIVTREPLSVRRAAERCAADLKREFAHTDPKMSIEVLDSVAVMCMDAASTKRVTEFLASAPDGVQSMSADLPDLVQTSLNLGILKTSPEAVSASFCVRSSDAAEKSALLERLRALTESPAGRRKNKDAIAGQMTISGDYPAWKYAPFSPIRSLCAEVFETLYRTPPKIEAIHAGLECGYFADKIRGLDCVSLGPDILDIHTPRERLRVSSTQRVWRFLLEVLKRAT